MSHHSSTTEINRAYLYMHISILIWGLTGVLGRGIELSEGLLVWYRLMIASASMGLFALIARHSFNIGWKYIARLFGTGVLLMLHWIFFYGAIKYSNVSITLSTFASTALFTAIMEPLVIKEKKFRKDELLYSAMAIAGIWLIFYKETSFSTGIILALLAAFAGSFINIFNKDIVKEVKPEMISFYQIFSGFVVLSCLLPLYINYFKPAKLIPNTQDWILLFILAIVCTQLTINLSLKALRHLSAFTLNLSINLEPVYGIGLAFFIYKENRELGWGFFAGTAIIMMSVLLHAYYSSKKSKDSLPTP